MNGTETAYDPTRHGPMGEDRFRGASGNVPADGRLEALNKRLYDFQDRLAGHRNNLHAVCDRLGGVVPEPALAKNGRDVPRPEPNGTVQAIESRLEEIYALLEECGRETDRLRQL